MAIGKPANGKIKRSSWRQFFLTLIIAGCFYIGSYLIDSFCGGYWLIPEMDGHDELSFGWALHTAFLWQPRFGHEAMGNLDFGGIFYEPLIGLDRKLIHPTVYLSDTNGFETITHLPASKVHPKFRDDYLTDVKGSALYNETNQIIQCTLRLTGSNNPRAITEIRMDRQLTQQLGASPPDGFIEKPFEDYQKIQKEKYVRWIGRTPLPRDTNVILKIPVQHPQTFKGVIHFYCALDQESQINHTKICAATIDNTLVSKMPKIFK